MKRVLVVGGSGALGRAVVTRFSEVVSSNRWQVSNIDFSHSAAAHKNYILDQSQSWESQLQTLETAIQSEPNNQFDAVIHVAGAFSPGNLGVGVDQVVKNWTANVHSAFTAAELASKFLNKGGFLSLTGAGGAYGKGCSFAVGYGMSKAATHNLAMSIRDDPTQLPEKSNVVCILPQTIDTPANREAMPDADTSSWTSPDSIAETLLGWCTDSNSRPTDLFVSV